MTTIQYEVSGLMKEPVFPRKKEEERGWRGTAHKKERRPQW